MPGGIERAGAIAIAAVAAVVASAPPARANIDNPFPDATVISPGVKLGYTFGDGGGFTYGAELTVLWRTGPDLAAILAHGPALNLSWNGGSFQLRAGWEIVSWFAGIEAGPALVSDRTGTHVAVGVSPWLGALVVPYYTYTWVPASDDVRELGTYLKLPLCFSCKSSGGGFDGFDFDDDD
jgi:hypothetical protein